MIEPLNLYILDSFSYLATIRGKGLETEDLGGLQCTLWVWKNAHGTDKIMRCKRHKEHAQLQSLFQPNKSTTAEHTNGIGNW
jgi:hypothetical protein